MRAALCVFIIALCTSKGVGSAEASGSTPPSEYAVKARILRLLLDYAQWPSDTQISKRKIIIGIIGDSPFDAYLGQQFASPQDQASKTLIYQANPSNLERFDAIFICRSESDRLNGILFSTKDKPILTMGDTRDFAARGVMINLIVTKGKINIEVNLKATRASKIEINSHLLKSAKIIE